MRWIFYSISAVFLILTQMTATLNVPQSAALGMLSKAQNGNELLTILDAVVDTQEDQVPVSFDYIESPMIKQILGISDAYIMENDYDDSMDV